jgi:serine/threonine protein kinase
MEYVAGGRTLQRHTRPNTLLAIEDFVRVAFKCAKALDYAHRKGVIHRDIKPKNILLTEQGEVKVSDFSVALRTGLDVTETQVDGYLGSPLYMSPEQVRGESLTHKSDIFSLGVLMYELLTGKTPFAAAGIAAVIYQITAKDPVPATQIRTEIPIALQDILDRALRKDPNDRYASAIELAADLSRIVDELGLEEESPSRTERFHLLRKLSFFDEFPEPEIWEVLNAAIWQEYEPDDAIIHEGEIDNSFYVIVRGEVAVRKRDMEVDALREGDCFGEMGSLPGRQRSVGIRAKGQVSAIKIRSSLIEQASKDTQLRFHRVFLNKIVERLSRANEKIYLELHSQPARRASARG